MPNTDTSNNTSNETETMGLAPERKRSIFEIDQELDQVTAAFDQLEEGGEEEAVKEAVMSYFGNVLDQRDRKLDNYARLISDRTALAKAQKAEGDRLIALAKSNETMAKRLKDLLKFLFDSKKWTKFDTPLHKFWIQNNGGLKPLTVLTENASEVPERFHKVTTTIDTDKIRAALDAGEVLEFAMYSEVGTHLRIK